MSAVFGVRKPVNGPLPIFGASERNRFYPGITYGGAISAVPEPGTYALVLGGPGILGMVARRKRAAALG